MAADDVYLAAVEGGGTTFVASVARLVPLHEAAHDDKANDAPNNDDVLRIGPTKLQLVHTATFPAKDGDTGEIPNWPPAQILEATCSFLKQHLPASGRYAALGIATFGPAGVDPAQSSYGTILSGSPKREWRGVDLLTPIAEACGLDGAEGCVGFDTDVNAPALAEFRHRCHLRQSNQSQHAGKPLTSLSYVTIGTGVGVGLVLNSLPVHGLMHPEGGHVAVQPLEGDAFEGYSWGTEKSPYGGVNTVEGVASSVALTERYLQMWRSGHGAADSTVSDASDAQAREVLGTLPDSHPIWKHAANAIANLCVSLLLLTSCQKIVLGGGVMKRTVLFGMVRKRVWILLNGYLDSVDELSEEGKLDDVIVPSSWESVGSGLAGAFALALDAYEKENGGDSTKQSSKGNMREEQRKFTSGVLVGIGVSFGCALLTSLLGRGRRR
ncbi:hypothetical protein ACHAXT_005764 [Thalassiosira profunda]